MNKNFLQSNAFQKVAPYYDLLMEEVPYEMWVRYYLRLLHEQGIYPHTFLDVCCGTGTIAEKLYQRGYDIVGIDLSQPMIEQACIKAENHGYLLEYCMADASDFHLHRKFDAAYSFFDSLNYILEPEKLKSAFKCVAAHLNNGGSFVFDLTTAYAFEKNFFDQEDFDPEIPVKYRWRSNYNSSSRIVEVAMEFWHEDQYFSEVHLERAHSRDEVREFLTAAGFRDIEFYNSYTFVPPNRKSDRVHCAALLEG